MAPIRIVQIEPQYFAAMEQIRRDCFPTLGSAELMRVQHFESQLHVFPDGQFVAVEADSAGGDSERVVGMGSGFFTDFDFAHPYHTFRGFTDNFLFRNHDPAGAYYYGADVSVHPDYRGRGIGRMLYDVRMGLVRRTNRRGIVAGGVIPGYDSHRSMTPAEYVRLVEAGTLFDPTLSVQLKFGFRMRGMLPDYIEDSASDNWAVLIEWLNPEYQETLRIALETSNE